MKQTISKSMILLTIIVMDLLTGMEFDLFVPSFPELQQHFNLTPFWLEALLSINFLGYCLSLFFVGGSGRSLWQKACYFTWTSYFHYWKPSSSRHRIDSTAAVHSNYSIS